MPRKVLVVDDNEINRAMLRHVLGEEYDVVEAEDGKAALTLIHRYYKVLSAVLLDIMMPEIDGYEVLRQVRANALLTQLPVIMVTGTEDESSRVKALSLGANDFIQKPFNPDIIRHCLRNTVALRETASILNAIQRDKLTGLYNREAFFEKAALLIKDREPGSYILSAFDIDNFKLINDQYGAQEGDRLLRETGRILRLNMDRLGGLAARISADNFAAVFPADKQDSGILQSAGDLHPEPREQRSVAFSVGRCLIADTSLSVSAIYDRAYLAKQSVKGRYDRHLAWFDEAMLQRLIRDQEIAGEMESALAQRQFEVWFQPQYNHATGALIGSEALVRWRHPKRGLIPPGEFIPLFEQNGFIYELDQYVWRETCRYLRGWLDLGLSPLPVSVNISRYDIFRADLIDNLTGLIREYALPVELLRLEITESAFSKSTKLIVEIVRQLIALRFTVEIDDFGSGYSSLNTLKSVPAQVVKLDMRFLEDGNDNQRGGSILEAIVRMAKWLGMNIIAEGVETLEQGNFLKSIGCSSVQGYLYARPMPAAEYELLFRRSAQDTTRTHLHTVAHMNNDTFWDPRSVDSLVFNSFVGAASVFEYRDGQLELLRATDKFAHLLGGESMTVDDLMELELLDYLAPDTADEARAWIAQAVDARQETTGELNFLNFPGRPGESAVRVTMRVIASTDDRHLVYCLSESITAQRTAESKERRAVQQLKLVLDHVDCGISSHPVCDGRYGFVAVNETYCKLFGYTQENFGVADRDIWSVICPEDLDYAKSVVTRVVDTGATASMEYRGVRRDGSRLWLRSSLSLVQMDGETVLLCTYADITAQRLSAQDLLDHLPCGAGICVLNGDDVRMTYLNHRYFTYFSQGGQARRASSVFDVIHPDDRAALRTAMLPAFREGAEGSCTVRILDTPGRYLTFRVTGAAVPLPSGERVIYAAFLPLSEEERSVTELVPAALETLLDASPELTFFKDTDLRYLGCSRPFAEATGALSPAEVVGKTDAALCDPALANAFAEEDRSVLRGDGPVLDVTRAVPTRDGGLRYVTTSKFPLWNSRGEIVGICGLGRDVTDDRETAARQSFLLNSIPGGAVVYQGRWTEDLSQIRVTFFSDGFCRLFGYSREEMALSARQNPLYFIDSEFLPGLSDGLKALSTNGTPLDYVYRTRNRAGEVLWLHVKAVSGGHRGDDTVVYAVFFDVTAHQLALEQLRLREEEYRLALRHCRNAVCQYDPQACSLAVADNINPLFGLPPVLENIPEGQISQGLVSPETVSAYRGLFASIRDGRPEGAALWQWKTEAGWRWIDARFSTVFSRTHTPMAAVISFNDVTETLKKDAVWSKWRQSLRERPESSYSLLRGIVSHRMTVESVEGTLLPIRAGTEPMAPDELVARYARGQVLPEDRERLLSVLGVETLLERYARGERLAEVEYRELLPEGGARWLRLIVDLMEYPNCSDVEGCFLFEDIDQEKRAALSARELAETDPLTGLLNRAAFARGVDAALAADPRGALMMLDLDGFKQVNDSFGHAAGDQTLVEVGDALRGVLRRDDLLCRLGGDEFVAFLPGLSREEPTGRKARQLEDACRRRFSPEVAISGSVGVALAPKDGTSFDALYHRADLALYHVKNNGRDAFAFYQTDMTDRERTYAPTTATPAPRMERRMLIVDDSPMDCALLAHMFGGDFRVETVGDGSSALARLRHLGTAVSVVLLDLMMPGLDGFGVLEKLAADPVASQIPVVVVSGADDRETSLQAIRAGASDFVTKPVDREVLRIRVDSAVSKAENQRLRARNSSLEYVEEELTLYRSAAAALGTGVAWLNRETGVFSYTPSLSACLQGRFGNRSLWQILEEQQGAGDPNDPCLREQLSRLRQQVETMSQPDKTAVTLRLTLRDPAGEWRSFLIGASLLPGDGRDMVLFTFTRDPEPEKPGSDEIQARKDESL